MYLICIRSKSITPLVSVKQVKYLRSTMIALNSVGTSAHCEGATTSICCKSFLIFTTQFKAIFFDVLHDLDRCHFQWFRATAIDFRGCFAIFIDDIGTMTVIVDMGVAAVWWRWWQCVVKIILNLTVGGRSSRVMKMIVMIYFRIIVMRAIIGLPSVLILHNVVVLEVFPLCLKKAVSVTVYSLRYC